MCKYSGVEQPGATDAKRIFHCMLAGPITRRSVVQIYPPLSYFLDDSMELSKEDSQELLKISRQFLEKAVRKETAGKPVKYPDALNANSGVVCTIFKNGKRHSQGSSGTPYPLFSIIDSALHGISSTSENLLPSDLNEIKIELDIISEPQKITGKNPSEILARIHEKDGLLLKFGMYESFMLPRDWKKMTKEEFLEKLCINAGLTKDMWKESSAEISRFQVKVLKED